MNIDVLKSEIDSKVYNCWTYDSGIVSIVCDAPLKGCCYRGLVSDPYCCASPSDFTTCIPSPFSTSIMTCPYQNKCCCDRDATHSNPYCCDCTSPTICPNPYPYLNNNCPPQLACCSSGLLVGQTQCSQCQEPEASTWYIWLIVILVILAIAAGVGFFFFKKMQQRKQQQLLGYDKMQDPTSANNIGNS